LTGKNASKAIIKTVNTATGKESVKDKAFTELNWGAKTKAYLQSVEKVDKVLFAKIATKAQAFAKMSGRIGDGSLMAEDIECDERACLMDATDDEEDGMSTNLCIH
jgi:hypothetical protein